MSKKRAKIFTKHEHFGHVFILTLPKGFIFSTTLQSLEMNTVKLVCSFMHYSYFYAKNVSVHDKTNHIVPGLDLIIYEPK